MTHVNLRDDVFDHPDGEWRHIHADEHFTQRFRRETGPPIWCETLMTVPGVTTVDAALSLICGPWNWWEHGNIAGFTRNADGSSDQTLSPVWWFVTRVNLHMFPPVPLPDLKGWRVPLLLTRHFDGPSSMDVYPDDRNNALIVRGRFHGVEYRFAAYLDRIAERLHLGAEAGTMPPPFPKGTGWVGLFRRLKATASPDVANEGAPQFELSLR